MHLKCSNNKSQYTGSPLTDDDDVIGDVVAAMTVCDVTGVHPVVLLSDGADLQSAVLQPTQSENGGGWRRETRTNGEQLMSPRQQFGPFARSGSS